MKCLQNLREYLLKYALLLTKGNHQLADDLVQDVLLICLQRKIIFNKKYHEGYYIKMIRNKFIDLENSSKPIVALDFCIKLPCDNVKEKESESYILYKKARQLLQSHKYGWILLEIINKQITLKELAELKRVDYETLRKRKYRLIKRLRNELGDS